MEWLNRSSSWVRNNRVLATIIAALLILAVGSAWSAYRFRSEAVQAKKEIQTKEAEGKAIAREQEIEKNAWDRQMADREVRLSKTQSEIRTLRGRLGEIEARRRDLFDPPAVDNLAARFDRALEALR